MKYGCHNRAPYKEPHRMSPNCEYTKTDLGKADARCVGCKWREQNELAIPTTSTSAVDSEANQRIRATTTRTTARGSAMRQALEIAIDYMNERLEDHDCKYQRHPATEAERINILADIETVKEALAQPEQEPRTAEEKLARMKAELAYMRKSQPEQEPVAFETWHETNYVQSLEKYGDTYKNSHVRCRYEGWLGAKSTPPQPEQEPVGHGGSPMTLREIMESEDIQIDEWNGLTDKQKLILIRHAPDWTVLQLIEQVEDMLKGNNK